MIPFVDLTAQFARIEQDVRRRMDAVLAHGKFIMGPEVAELERELAAFAGVEHCVSCASGTDALLLPLMALGVGPGDAVFTSPFTFIATAEVISLLGATPVFVDIDASFNIDPARLDLAIQAVKANDPSRHPLPRAKGQLTPKVVIPVDMFGLPADYVRCNAIAAAHGLHLLSDAAQSLGSEYTGRKAAAAARITATSFFPAKPLGCYGDGGAVFTSDADMAALCQSLRLHGKGGHKYDNVRIGINGRLDTLQAAVLLAKLPKRRAVARAYTGRMASIPGIRTPETPENSASAWAQYTLRHPRRDAIMDGLKARGVPSVIYYPRPLHLQTAFAPLGYAEGAFPTAEAASREVFSLPMHPYLSAADVDVICDAVADAAS